jgi:hypothetical protein
LLCGIYRLHSVNVFGDIGWQHLFGWHQPKASYAFKAFLKHMIQNWLFLITNHEQFWLSKLPIMAEAIRKKMENLGSIFPSAYEENGFNIFGFIDCNCLVTCRPGGGPVTDGRNAGRNDPLIQRAFYNGWKKHHGYKFQTVDLPNGMNFNVWGPVSLRHNDLFTFYESGINAKIAAVQQNFPLQFKIYGDSAYAPLWDSHIMARFENPDNLEVLHNKNMSSCRECIEWDYGDLRRYFKILDFRHGLKIRQMDVADIYLVASILRNAYVTMNGSNTAEYFDCKAPSFEEWIGR